MVGVLVPDVGTLLIAAVPTPAFVQDSWMRLAMLIGALTLPLGIGLAAVSVASGTSRPRGVGLVMAILRGYPFAVVLALILVMLIGVATVTKAAFAAASLGRRARAGHRQARRYEEVLALLRAKLDSGGLPTTPRDAGMLISGPPKLLDLVAGRALGDLVPDRLQLLVGENLEVLRLSIGPGDLRDARPRRHGSGGRSPVS